MLLPLQVSVEPGDGDAGYGHHKGQYLPGLHCGENTNNNQGKNKAEVSNIVAAPF